MKLQDIEDAFRRFTKCPRCSSKQGFWLGIKSDRAYAMCKGCGAKFELYEVYPLSENKEREASRRLRFLRR